MVPEWLWTSKLILPIPFQRVSISEKYQSRVADLLYHNSRENLNTGAITYFNYFNENTQNKEGILH